MRVCQRQSQIPPKTIRSSAEPEICGRTETAPGHDATHLPVATIGSMPSPPGLERPSFKTERHGDQAEERRRHDQEADEGRRDQIGEQSIMRHAVEVVEGKRCDGHSGHQGG